MHILNNLCFYYKSIINDLYFWKCQPSLILLNGIFFIKEFCLKVMMLGNTILLNWWMKYEVSNSVQVIKWYKTFNFHKTLSMSRKPFNNRYSGHFEVENIMAASDKESIWLLNTVLVGYNRNRKKYYSCYHASCLFPLEFVHCLSTLKSSLKYHHIFVVRNRPHKNSQNFFDLC